MTLFTQSALLRALGWSLVNSLWQMGLLWLVYQVFVSAFRKSSPQTRHNFAVGLLGIGLLWAIVGLVGNMAAKKASGAGWQEYPNFSQGTTGQGWRTVQLVLNTAIPYCSSFYLTILAILVARYVRSYWASRRLIHTGLSRINPEFRVFTEEMARRMGIRPAVRVWLSSRVDVPLTMGFLKPMILMPVAMANHLTLEQTEAILLHELAHIRRNDYLVHLGMAVLELFFFFNPFTRLLLQVVKNEREHHCDDLVLQFRYDPRHYVAALLCFAHNISHPGRERSLLALAATGGGDDRLLLQRVRRILRQGEPNARKTRLFALLPVILALSLGGACVREVPVVSTTKPFAQVSGKIYYTLAAARIIAVPEILSPFTGSGESVFNPHRSAGPTEIRKGKEKKVRAGGQMRSNDADSSEDLSPLHANNLAANPVRVAAGDGEITPSEAYAAVILPDVREFSMGENPTVTLVPVPDIKQAKKRPAVLPFVPASSFSFQYMEDTVRPVEQLAYLQLYNQLEVATAMKKLQADLQDQCRALQAKQAAAARSSKISILRLQEQQTKLQQQFLLKLSELQKKMDKANRQLKIVYI